MNPGDVSPAQFVAYDREAWNALTPLQRFALVQRGRFWVRPNQRPPSTYRYCTYLAGRGFGKTTALAYTLNQAADAMGPGFTLGLAAQDEKRTIDVQVKALVATAPRWNRCELFKEAVIWENGASALVFSPEAPSKPRGASLSHAWMTEVGHWNRSSGLKTFHNIVTACRVHPAQVLVDTTSHGRSEIVDYLLELNAQDPARYPVIRGTTFDAPNLTRDYLREQTSMYAGRAAREELWGEVFGELDGANWERAWLDDHRVETAPHLELVLVGVDVAESTRADADDTGLIVAGRARDGQCYVLADKSGKHTSQTFARTVIDEWRTRATGAVLETNRGGQLVSGIVQAYAAAEGIGVEILRNDAPWPVRSRNKIYLKLVHSRGDKHSRHTAPAALYANGRCHHVGTFSELEHQMTTYVNEGPSPDNLDALSLALVELADLGRDTRPNAAARRIDLQAAAIASGRTMQDIRARFRQRSVV